MNLYGLDGLYLKPGCQDPPDWASGSIVIALP